MTPAIVRGRGFVAELPELWEDFPDSPAPKGRRFDDVIEGIPNLAEENVLALLNLAASLLAPGESYVEVGSYYGASLIGAGMRSHPGVTAKFFAALASAGVNIEMISTSEIRISVILDESQVDAAVAAAHTAFDLDSDQVEAVIYGGTGR